MKKRPTTVLGVCLSPALLLLSSHLTLAQPKILWEAFNDHRPSDLTDPNATGYDMRVTDDGGILRNIATGEDLPASMTVLAEGDLLPDDFGANSPVNAGSPADKLFAGKVDVGNAGITGLRSSANIKITLKFTGLDPTKRYNFRGTASRGGKYNDRWSVFGIVGADAYVAAHEDGSVNKNIITKATFDRATLEPNQVALNTGENTAGSLVGWDNIEPGEDGEFDIEAQQYTGAAPFGNPSAAAYAYGLDAIYVAELESTGNLRITENPPPNQLLPAGKTGTLKVVATSPQTISYQWQKANPGTTAFTDIPGANQATYVTPPLTLADSGTTFRCVLTSGGNQTTSGESQIQVDGTIPTLVSATGSINFNSAYIKFSEPMNLDLLAVMDNYKLSGGLAINSVSVLDPVTVRLLTGPQPMTTSYTVTINNVEDIAGNKIAANSAASFTSFGPANGVVGLELWNNLGGGAIQDLRNTPLYPNEPDVDYSTTAMDSTLLIPDGPNNTYGGRFRAWLTPEESGDYEFFIRADDSGELRISSDDSFDDLENPDRIPDAVDTTIGDPFEEPGFDTSTSLPITLEKGKRYAVQFIWKESNGNDHAQLAWRKVGDETPADQLLPIPSNFFSYYGPQTVVTRPTISLARDGAKLRLEWTQGLQSSDDLKSWTDETTAVSPLSVTPAAHKFYRSKK